MKSVTSSDVKKQEKKKHDMMTIASITKKIKDLKEKISLGENMKTDYSMTAERKEIHVMQLDDLKCQLDNLQAQLKNMKEAKYEKEKCEKSQQLRNFWETAGSMPEAASAATSSSSSSAVMDLERKCVSNTNENSNSNSGDGIVSSSAETTTTSTENEHQVRANEIDVEICVSNTDENSNGSDSIVICGSNIILVAENVNAQHASTDILAPVRNNRRSISSNSFQCLCGDIICKKTTSNLKKCSKANCSKMLAVNCKWFKCQNCEPKSDTSNLSV